MSASSPTVVGGLIFSATPPPGSLFPLFHGCYRILFHDNLRSSLLGHHLPSSDPHHLTPDHIIVDLAPLPGCVLLPTQHLRNTHNWTHCYTSNFQLTAVSKLPHRTCKLNNKASFPMTYIFMDVYFLLPLHPSRLIEENVMTFWHLGPVIVDCCLQQRSAMTDYPGMVAGCNV